MPCTLKSSDPGELRHGAGAQVRESGSIIWRTRPVASGRFPEPVARE